MNLLYVLVISVPSGVAYSFDGVAYRFGAQVNLNSWQVLLPVVTLSARGCGKRAIARASRVESPWAHHF